MQVSLPLNLLLITLRWLQAWQTHFEIFQVQSQDGVDNWTGEVQKKKEWEEQTEDCLPKKKINGLTFASYLLKSINQGWGEGS